MKTKKLSDLAAELEGISALIAILSQPFMENDATTAMTVVGDALFALENYTERIADDLEIIADSHAKGVWK